MKHTTQVNLNGNLVTDKSSSKKLTWRQKQTLLSIYWEIKNFGSVTLSDVVGDVGVAVITLSGHLNSLYKKNLITEPLKPCKNPDKPYINIGFEDKLELTEEGVKTAENEINKINATVNDPLGLIFDRLKADYGDVSFTKSNGFNLNSSAFSKAYTKLIKNKNLTEPVITSIALYTELDSQLNFLSMEKDGTKQNPIYRSLTQDKLNTVIRIGRLSSLAIPVMLRSEVPYNEARSILEDSWTWLNTVSNKQIDRYMNEASSLELISQSEGKLSTLKPSATDLIYWLATKTGDAFMNNANPAPKASLIVYKESFNLPTIEDLLSPNHSNLSWAQQIFDETPKDVYINSINESIDVLINQAKVLEKLEGDRLIPKTIYREVSEAPDIKLAFDTIMKFSEKENNLVANILLAIIATPGITVQGLYNKIKSSTNIEQDKLESVINNLARKKGLIHTARSVYSKDMNTVKLYAFSHIPHFGKSKSSKDDNLVGEANAVSKGMVPWILSSIKDFFPDDEEKRDLYRIISDLIKEKEVYFDDIDSYNRKLSRKIGTWSYTLKPFIEFDKDFTMIKIPDSRLGVIILDTLQFSILTSNDALSIYNCAMSNFVTRDDNLMNKIDDDGAILKTGILKTKRIPN